MCILLETFNTFRILNFLLQIFAFAQMLTKTISVLLKKREEKPSWITHGDRSLLLLLLYVYSSKEEAQKFLSNHKSVTMYSSLYVTHDRGKLRADKPVRGLSVVHLCHLAFSVLFYIAKINLSGNYLSTHLFNNRWCNLWTSIFLLLYLYDSNIWNGVTMCMNYVLKEINIFALRRWEDCT